MACDPKALLRFEILSTAFLSFKPEVQIGAALMSTGMLVAVAGALGVEVGNGVGVGMVDIAIVNPQAAEFPEPSKTVQVAEMGVGLGPSRVPLEGEQLGAPRAGQLSETEGLLKVTGPLCA